jgi:hypothetical protein
MIRKLWTDEKPKWSGYYWFKYAEDGFNKPGEIDIVYVKRGTAHFTQGMMPVKLKEMTRGKWHGPIPFPSLHRANKHESGLKDLTLAVIDCLAALDYVMERRESPERDKAVAKIANHLNYANDAAMHFALGMDFDAISALKRKRERLRIKAQKEATTKT